MASIKLGNIVQALSSHDNLSIRLVLTTSAAQFLAGQSHEQPTLAEISTYPNVDGIYTDEAEWARPWRRNAPILHIELRKWADLLVVAPLSANTMAKVVAGMCDNLLTSVIRAWDVGSTVDGGKQKKIIFATAMNTAMWRNPITAKHIKVLEEEWGGEHGWTEVLRPIAKTLACGDVGEGAMVEWKIIVGVIEWRLELMQAHEEADE